MPPSPFTVRMAQWAQAASSRPVFLNPSSIFPSMVQMLLQSLENFFEAMFVSKTRFGFDVGLHYDWFSMGVGGDIQIQ